MFYGGWTDTPVAWENVSFNIPSGDQPWVRHQVEFISANNASFGVVDSEQVRITGMVSVQIFTPLDEGSGLSDEYTDKVVDIYQNKVDGPIFFYASELVVIGDGVRRVDQIEEGFFQVNVLTRFQVH
jgi:hypothetical protein